MKDKAVKLGIRAVMSWLVGMFIGALPACPILVMSSFSEDRPAFWIWPFFGTIIGVLMFVSQPWER